MSDPTDQQSTNQEEKQLNVDNPKTNKKRPAVVPVILIVIGIMWLLNNLGIDWLGDIWLPSVVIIIGAWLLLKDR